MIESSLLETRYYVFDGLLEKKKTNKHIY